jgi:hypothetical protein
MTQGLDQLVVLGLRIAPTLSRCAGAAAEIARVMDAGPSTPVRIAGVGQDGSRVVVTLAITLGTVSDIKAATPAARDAVTFIAGLVAELRDFDPAFIALPDHASADARIASHLRESTGMTLPVVMASLAGHTARQ